MHITIPISATDQCDQRLVTRSHVTPLLEFASIIRRETREMMDEGSRDGYRLQEAPRLTMTACGPTQMQIAWTYTMLFVSAQSVLEAR